MPKALTSQRTTLTLGGAVFAVAFLGLFVVLGLAITYVAAIQPIVRVERARSWTPARCNILSSALRRHPDHTPTYDVRVRYEWNVGQQVFEGSRYDLVGGSSSNLAGWRSIADRLRPGTAVDCWFDPRDPSQATLVRDIGAGELAVRFVPLIFVAIPLLIVWAAFRKHPSKFVRQPRNPPLSVSDAGPVALKPASTPAGRLAAALFFAIFWNGIVWLALAPAAFGGDGGWSRWPLRLLFVLFAAIGVRLLVMAVRALWALWAPRVSVTASGRSARLGDRLSVTWTFRGNDAAISKVAVAIVGQEVARSTDRSGDGTPSTRRQVRSFRRLAVATVVAPGAGTGGGSVILPVDTVPTFSARNNEVAWAVVVEASLHHLPDLREEFPIVLVPAVR